MKRLTLALDYDHTFTADAELWRAFITAAQARGHTVVCVTGRTSMPDFSREPSMPAGVGFIFAGADFKRHAASRAGFAVDIWIDDMPEMIAPTRVLDFNA